MADPGEALRWITEVLHRRRVPFQAVGGLAARAHGTTRPLADLDFYIPMERWSDIEPAVAAYVVQPPVHHRDAYWDLVFAKLLYADQKIELGDATNALIFDSSSGEWIRQMIDFDSSEWVEMFGIRVRVMGRGELIAYKQRLNRDVDRADLAELLAR
jgi:hypothetical protein